jgi:hypothetical protein
MREEQQLKITFREANITDVLAVAKVHIQSWRESFAGIVPQTYLDKMSVENRAKAFEKGFTALISTKCLWRKHRRTES